MIDKVIQLLMKESQNSNDITHLFNLCEWAQVNLDCRYSFRFIWLAYTAESNDIAGFKGELRILKDYRSL